MLSLPRSHGTGVKDFPSLGRGPAAPRRVAPLGRARVGLSFPQSGRGLHAMPRFGRDGHGRGPRPAGWLPNEILMIEASGPIALGKTEGRTESENGPSKSLLDCGLRGLRRIIAITNQSLVVVALRYRYIGSFLAGKRRQRSVGGSTSICFL